VDRSDLDDRAGGRSADPVILFGLDRGIQTCQAVGSHSGLEGYQDTAREIWKRYATTHLEPAVAAAVAAGVLRKDELPAELVQHIAGLIEFYEHDFCAP
jgi:hypothetical protein